jgi:hypothetical protein
MKRDNSVRGKTAEKERQHLYRVVTNRNKI